MKKSDDERARETTSWVRYSHLGLTFGLSLTLPILAGRWADVRFGTDPWWTIAGSLFGIFAGIYLLLSELGFLGKKKP